MSQINIVVRLFFAYCPSQQAYITQQGSKPTSTIKEQCLTPVGNHYGKSNQNVLTVTIDVTYPRAHCDSAFNIKWAGT